MSNNVPKPPHQFIWKGCFLCVCTIAPHPRVGAGRSERRKATLSAVNMMDDSWILLINDQEDLEIVACATLKSGARMSALETSATSNAATLLSLCSFAHQIICRESSPWSAALATSVWTPRCSLLLHRMSHSQRSGNFIRLTIHGSVSLLRQGAGSVSPCGQMSLTNLNKFNIAAVLWLSIYYHCGDIWETWAR